MSKVASNSTAHNKKTDHVEAAKLYVRNRTLQVLSRIVLISFVAFVVFKILLIDALLGSAIDFIKFLVP